MAWTSPYTITPSAINSWVGQELRTIGGEATVSHRSADLEIAGTAAAFAVQRPRRNPAGLARVGFRRSDDRPVRPPQAAAHTPHQTHRDQRGATAAPYDKPFREIDGRIGYYANLSLDYAGYGKISVMRYDNRADNRIYGDDEWAWNTAFWSFGLSTRLDDGIELLAQGMTGTTTLITTAHWPSRRCRLSVRICAHQQTLGQPAVSASAPTGFDTKDRDVFPDNNNENGYALTLAYILRPKPKQRLTVELLYVDSHRPERQYQGLPVNGPVKTQFQVSYRFFM